MSQAQFHPEGISQDDRVIGWIAAALVCVGSFWEALFYLVPALSPDRVHISPRADNLLYPALYFLSTLPFYWLLLRPLRAALGVGPFTRFFCTLVGLFVSGSAVHWTWSDPQRADLANLVGAATGIFMSQIGQVPALKQQRAAFMTCLVGTPMAWGLLTGHHADLGLAVAVIAAIAGLVGLVSRIGLRPLLALVCGQVATEWLVARGDIVRYVTMIAVSFVLFFGSGPVNQAFPGLIQDWQLPLIFGLCCWLFFYPLYKLVAREER